MATGAKTGLSPARKIGSAPDNQGLVEYTIASGYGTSIGTGDPVKLSSSGTLQLATNGDTVIGVFAGCSYTDSSGVPQESAYFPASTTGTIKARVRVKEGNTFFVKTDYTPATTTKVGDLLPFGAEYATVDTAFGLSGLKVYANPTAVGTVDIEGETDLGANTSISDNDQFKVRSLSGSTQTLTIEDGDGTAELLAKINAVANVHASLTADGYLKIVSTDGNDLFLEDTTGTPLADLGVTPVGRIYRSSIPASSTGTVDIAGEDDIGANIANIADGDAFSVVSSASGQAATTITIADGDGDNELLDKLNAVTGIKASLTSSGYLKIETTDGGNLTVTDVTNNPGAYLGLHMRTISSPDGMLKVESVIDATAGILEVSIV